MCTEEFSIKDQANQAISSKAISRLKYVLSTMTKTLFNFPASAHLILITNQNPLFRHYFAGRPRVLRFPPLRWYFSALAVEQKCPGLNVLSRELITHHQHWRIASVHHSRLPAETADIDSEDSCMSSENHHLSVTESGYGNESTPQKH